MPEEIPEHDPPLVWYDLGMTILPIIENDEENSKCYLFDGLRMSNWISDLMSGKRFDDEPSYPVVYNALYNLLDEHKDFSLLKSFLMDFYKADVEEALRSSRPISDDEKHKRFMTLIKSFLKKGPDEILPGLFDASLVEWVLSVKQDQLPADVTISKLYKTVLRNEHFMYPSVGTNGSVGGAHSGKIMLKVQFDHKGYIRYGRIVFF